MSDSSSSAAGGFGGFGGLLAIAFIVLKLCHVIDWSWLWVLSPLWLPLALVATLLLVCAVGWLLTQGALTLLTWRRGK